MATILVIDTSGRQAAAAGLSKDGLTNCKFSNSNRHGAQEILRLVDEVVSEADARLNEIDGIVALTGPGSFTGLRIGIGAAQGLSAALAIPTIPVSTLAFTAWQAAQQFAPRHWLVAQAAREHEIYFGAYSVDSQSAFAVIGKEQVASIESLDFQSITAMEGSDWGAVGEGWGEFAQVQSLLPVNAQYFDVDIAKSVEDLCRLGLLLLTNAPAPGDLLLPNYVKEQMDYS